jgi:NAD(P)-dependent dehydrogenase (short-subunit alcohol dehydrogenase family)
MMHLLGYISLKDLNWKSRPYSAWVAYGQSKLANLLFTKELQRRLDAAGSRVRAHAAHPGYSETNLQGHSGRRVGDALMSIGNKLATDADFGARQTLYAASQDLPGNSYIGPRLAMRGATGPTPFRSPLARNPKTAAALWELSEQLTDTKFAL